MSGSGRTGTSLGGMEFSPDRRKRNAARRKRQEQRWAKRSGPVVTKRLDDGEPGQPQADAEPNANDEDPPTA